MKGMVKSYTKQGIPGFKCDPFTNTCKPYSNYENCYNSITLAEKEVGITCHSKLQDCKKTCSKISTGYKNMRKESGKTDGKATSIIDGYKEQVSRSSPISIISQIAEDDAMEENKLKQD
jgi:hypothetical protein